MATQHRTGLDEASLVTRHLKLEHLEAGRIDAIVSQIDALIGIDRVTARPDKPVLDVVYDASASDHLLADIEQILHENGCDISHDRWMQFKKHWYEHTDANVYENARHEAFCCDKPPPGK